MSNKKYKLLEQIKTIPEWCEIFPFMRGRDFSDDGYGFEEVVEPERIEVSGDSFLNYLVSQKEKYVKEQDFETASNWRLVERCYRAYRNPPANYVPIEQVVAEYLKKGKSDKPLTSPAPESKDWEIVSYEFDNRIYIPNVEPYIELSNGFLDEKYKIHSVRRLSDNTVFEVGEETTSDARYLYKPIKRFFEKEGVMYVQFNEGHGSNDGCLGLNALQKLPPKPQPLFVTEDGKKIFEGHSGALWRVFTGNSSFESWKPYNLGVPPFPVEGEKYFSTKEAADEYCLMAKPCLSINDIVSLWVIDQYGRENLKKLVKSKSTNH